MLVVVDFGTGNLGSLANMLSKIGVAAVVSDDVDTVASAERVVLPGVGAFDAGMRNLAERGLVEPLKAVKDRGVPILGICLGMQLLTAGSEEGRLPGLGWLDARAERFDAPGLKVPHMGWNLVRATRPDRLFIELDDARFYFAHSYRVVCADAADVLATATYGGEFTCAVQRDNVSGVQFHPEKSRRFGMRLLQNFAAA